VNGLRQLWRGGLKAVVGLSSATVAGQLLVALAMPALTRLYTAEAMGVFATFSGLATTVFVAAGLRYEAAIPLARRDAQARLLLLLALGCGAVIALLSVPVIALWGDDIAAATDAPGLATLLWLVPPFVVLASANRAWQALAVRDRRFVDVARTRMVQAPATLVPQLGGGVLQLGAPALILGFILGQTAGLLSLMRGTGGPRALVDARARPWPRLVALARRYWRFPVLDMPAAFANTLAAHLPSLLLAALVSPAAAGLYAVHQRLLLGPAAIVTQAIGQVLLGDVRVDLANGAIRHKAPRVAAMLSAIAVVVAVVGFFVIDPVMSFALGPAFSGDHVPYARFVLVGVCAQFVFSPLSVLLSATKAQGLYLSHQLLLLVARAAALWWGASRGGAFDAVVAASMVSAVVYVVGAVVVVVHVRRVTARQ
jgi:O-antigen/teichoic acid export membrane protein